MQGEKKKEKKREKKDSEVCWYVYSCTRAFPFGPCWKWGGFIAEFLSGTMLRVTVLPDITESFCFWFNIVSGAFAHCSLLGSK